MSADPLYENRVDWTKWAQHAQAIQCAACGQTFQPNHPRRRFCGQEGCPGRQRRRNTGTSTTTAPRARRTRQPRRRTHGQLYALIADATLAVALQQPAGTFEELLRAARDLVQSARLNRPPAVERAATVRLLAVASARATQQQEPS